MSPKKIKDADKYRKSTTSNPSSWLESLYGLKMGSAPGLDGKSHPHILSFAPSSSVQAFAPVLSRRITVCRSFQTTFVHAAWLIYATGLMVVCAYHGFPDGEMGGGHPCKGDNGKNVQMCGLVESLEATVPEFRFLIAFVLAGFVGAVVSMWNTRRTNYAAVCGATRELSLLMGSFLPLPGAIASHNGRQEEQRLVQARSMLARWIVLAFELAVLKGKGLMDDETVAKPYLEDRQLLYPGEWDAMVKGDRHTTVYFWIQSYMVRLEREGLVHASYVLSFSQAVARARSQANDLMSSLSRDLPFPYVNLCYVLVYLNVLIFSTHRGVLWAVWLYGFGPQNLVLQPKFWVDLLATFAWNMSYTSLYHLCYVLYNPFGNDKNSVAHETIGGGLDVLAKSIATAHNCLPVDLVQAITEVSSDNSPVVASAMTGYSNSRRVSDVSMAV